jgi:multiple sugar transport system permease protein
MFAGPFAWLVLAALKQPSEWVAIPIHVLPAHWQWGNFHQALTHINFTAYLANSLFLSSLYAILVTGSSALVGFGFARLRGVGKRPLFLVLLSTMMLPQIGCGYGRIFLRIFLPLSRPVLLTSFLLSFTWVWGDYLAPALLLDADHTTLSVAITQSYRDPHGNYIPTIQAAAAALYVAPVLLIFLFAQRYFVRSVITSGVKG